MTSGANREIEVPLLDLAAQYESIRDEVEPAVRRVLEGQQFILGPEVDAFEADLADYCGTRHAIGCGSGSDAILLALMANDIGPGDEVLCPAYTFFATASAITRLGARPVFADIDPQTFNVTLDSVARAARSCRNLRAVLIVHLFGRMADVDALGSLAHELGGPLIEDAAQAIGAEDGAGRRAGSHGAIGCFSLYPTKNLGAAGDAGALVTNDDALAERLRSLRSHGASEPYRHHEVGINSRLDALQAAILRVKLRHLEAWTQLRIANAARYDAAFVDAGALDARADEGALEAAELPLRIPRPVAAPARHVYHHYVIRVPAGARDGLRDHLRKAGIASATYYPSGVHEQPCFSEGGILARSPESTRGLPETEAAARETLALPVYPELAETQQRRVVDAILSFFETR